MTATIDARASRAQRIDHVGILVESSELAAAYFTAEFGLERKVDWTSPSGQFRLVYLAAGDTTLQLVEPLAPGPLMDELQSRGESIHHVCFQVGELDEALSQLQSAPAGPSYVGGMGKSVCFLAERRFGVLVELTEAG